MDDSKNRSHTLCFEIKDVKFSKKIMKFLKQNERTVAKKEIAKIDLNFYKNQSLKMKIEIVKNRVINNSKYSK